MFYHHKAVFEDIKLPVISSIFRNNLAKFKWHRAAESIVFNLK